MGIAAQQVVPEGAPLEPLEAAPARLPRAAEGFLRRLDPLQLIAGIDGQFAPVRTAEEAVERKAQPARLHVPQRAVDGAERRPVAATHAPEPRLVETMQVTLGAPRLPPAPMDCGYVYRTPRERDQRGDRGRNT